MTGEGKGRRATLLGVYLGIGFVVGIAAFGLVTGDARPAAALFVVPLFALFAGLMAAPRACASFEPRALIRPLLAAGVAGAAGAHLVLAVGSAELWLGDESFAADLLLALSRGSFSGTLLAFAVGAVAASPLVLARFWNAILEVQVGMGLLGGLLAILLLGPDAVGESPALLIVVLPPGVLGAGSYLADRWILRGGLLARPMDSRLRGTLGIFAGLVVLFVPLAILFNAVGSAMLTLEPTRVPVIEAALEDCRGALKRLPVAARQLADLEGVDPELAAGLKEGYVIRFGSWREGDHSGWTLAADPLDDPGQAHYRLRSTHGGGLEISGRPLPFEPPR